MTIYDVSFYGGYYPNLRGIPAVRMSQSMFSIDKSVPMGARFTATVLRKFEGKRDVLKTEFKGGEVIYETLREPGMYFESGTWIETNYREAPKAFWEAYDKLMEKERARKQTNIFELTFYGKQEDLGIGYPKVMISLSRVVRDSELTTTSIIFTAKVLKEFKGNKYIIKLVSKDAVEYMPLFNSGMCYDTETEKWVRCRESPIPNKILKCYTKYLNE